MAPETTIEIRVAQPSDLPRVVEQYGHSGDTPWDPFASVDRLSAIPLEGLLVATLNGTYAGFLYWFDARKPWFDKGADRYARLEELHVVEEFRGYGVARALVERFVQESLDRGIPLLYVATDEDDRTTQELYTSVGFRPFWKTIHYRQYP